MAPASRKYRKVDPRVWGDERFRLLSDRGKLLFLCVLTHPHLTNLGGMRATPHGLGEELGWEPAEAREEFTTLLKTGLVRFDAKGPLVWLPNFLRYNPPESPNAVRSWSRALDLLPECAGLEEILRVAVSVLDGGPEPLLRALPEALHPYLDAPPAPEREEKPAPAKRTKHGTWSLDGKSRWSVQAGAFVPAEEWDA